MNVVLRCDASSVLGLGHVMRCLTLAEELRVRGTKATFISAELDGNACALIERRGFEVRRMPVAEVASRERWQADAEWSAVRMGEIANKVDWVIVDHYAIAAPWHAAVRSRTRGLMVIDDLADRRYDCDVLLDQNLVCEMDDRYIGKVSDGATCLLGPSWALLAPMYAQLREQVPPRAGMVRRVLVFFSGGDRAGMTRRAVGVLRDICPPEVRVDVVVAGQQEQVATIRALIGARDNFALHDSPASLAPLMARADLAVGATGATSWERLCLGLPAVVITLAENQKPIAQCLHEQGLVRWLGDASALDDMRLRDELAALLTQPLDPDWSRRCSGVVDGRGTARVSAMLTSSVATPLRARLVTPADERQLLHWANDPLTRSVGRSTAQISALEHKRWLAARLAEPDNCVFYIVETANEHLPIGQVRFQRAGQDWEIHYSLSPALRGRKMGAPMVRAALESDWAAGAARSIVGRVRKSNHASRLVFESLGFKLDDAPAEEMLTYRRMVAPRAAGVRSP